MAGTTPCLALCFDQPGRSLLIAYKAGAYREPLAWLSDKNHKNIRQFGRNFWDDIPKSYIDIP